MKWISVKDKLPNNNQIVAVYDCFCDEYQILKYTIDKNEVGHWIQMSDYGYDYSQKYDFLWCEMPEIPHSVDKDNI